MKMRIERNIDKKFKLCNGKFETRQKEKIMKFSSGSGGIKGRGLDLSLGSHARGPA